MPQMSKDYLGLLALRGELGEIRILDNIWDRYAKNVHPVAFIDESYDLSHSKTFYIVGLASVNHNRLNDTRDALTEFYSGDAMHASDMFARLELSSLRLATELVADENDGLDVVVCAPIQKEDKTGEAARRRCLEYLLPEIHSELNTELFVFDQRPLMIQDDYVLGDLRKGKQLSRDAVGVHCRPSEEPLLGLPDILAWSYRQHHKGKSEWFAPIKERAAVKILPVPPTIL
jgi:hypothetical protein